MSLESRPSSFPDDDELGVLLASVVRSRYDVLQSLMKKRPRRPNRQSSKRTVSRPVQCQRPLSDMSSVPKPRVMTEKLVKGFRRKRFRRRQREEAVVVVQRPHHDDDPPWAQSPAVKVPERSNEMRYDETLKWMRAHGKGEGLGRDLAWIRTLRKIWNKSRQDSIEALQECLASIGLQKTIDECRGALRQSFPGWGFTTKEDQSSLSSSKRPFLFGDFVEVVLYFEKANPDNSIVLTKASEYDDSSKIFKDTDILNFPSLAVGRFTRQRYMRDIANHVQAGEDKETTKRVPRRPKSKSRLGL